MQEVFEVQVDSMSKEFMRFNRFHLFRKNWFLAYMPTIVFGILGLAAFIDDDRSAAYGFWVIAPLIPLMMLAAMWLAAKRQLKTNKMFANMKNIYYRLDRNGIYNEVKNPKLKTTLETDWDHTYRVYESKDSFYIYISNMQAFLVPKADFVAGNPDDLSWMLKDVLGKKYFRR